MAERVNWTPKPPSVRAGTALGCAAGYRSANCSAICEKGEIFVELSAPCSSSRQAIRLSSTGIASLASTSLHCSLATNTTRVRMPNHDFEDDVARLLNMAPTKVLLLLLLNMAPTQCR